MNSLRFSDYPRLLVCVILGMIVRWIMFVGGQGVLDADEAIVGLMARHINEGQPWPIFYYGQPYMGSLEAICAALSFQWFGANGFALKFVPFFFSLIHIGLVMALTRRLFGSIAAFIAGLLTAVAPVGLVSWSSMARGGFIELVVLGTLSFILALDLLRAEKPKTISFAILGMVLGLGWWTNNQMIFYLLPVTLIFLQWFFRRYSGRQALGWFLATATGFFLGSAPFWYYNIFETPRWQTFDVLTRPQGGGGFFQHLQGFFSEAMPIILGARRFWSDQDIFPFSSWIAYGVWAIALFSFFQAASKVDHESLPRRRARSISVSLLVLFLILVPLIFSASSFGWLSKAPRYLLPLYSVLFLVVGAAFEHLWKSEKSGQKFLALAMLVGMLSLNLSSNFLGGVAVAGQPFVAHGERVSWDHRDLYSFLSREGYKHVWTNYWIGYRIAFETGEQVTFSRYGDPRTLRLPEYEYSQLAVPQSDESPRDVYDDDVYVLVPSQAGELATVLSRMGYVFRQTAVSGYVVVDHIRPESLWGPALLLRPEQMKVTSKPDLAGRMVDQDLTSRWGSGMPQQPGMGVEVWFEAETEIAGLEIDHGRYLSDLPRHLVVLGLLADGSWCELVDLGGIEPELLLSQSEFDLAQRVFRLHFAPIKVRALHLEQRDPGRGPFDWSIAELRVFPPLRD